MITTNTVNNIETRDQSSLMQTNFQLTWNCVKLCLPWEINVALKHMYFSPTYLQSIELGKFFPKFWSYTFEASNWLIVAFFFLILSKHHWVAVQLAGIKKIHHNVIRELKFTQVFWDTALLGNQYHWPLMMN